MSWLLEEGKLMILEPLKWILDAFIYTFQVAGVEEWFFIIIAYSFILFLFVYSSIASA